MWSRSARKGVKLLVKGEAVEGKVYVYDRV